MVSADLFELIDDGKLNKKEVAAILKAQADDMQQAHGMTYRCDRCSYKRYVDCPNYCS
jgi:hypothetical protein